MVLTVFTEISILNLQIYQVSINVILILFSILSCSDF